MPTPYCCHWSLTILVSFELELRIFVVLDHGAAKGKGAARNNVCLRADPLEDFWLTKLLNVLEVSEM